MFLSALKVFIALISPIVPIDIRSSIPIFVFSNFFAMYTTSRRFLSTSTERSEPSPSSLPIMSLSSSCVSGGGSVSGPFI